MFVKLAVCLVILATIASSCSALNAEWDQEWVRFVKTHNKVYKSKIEELHRRSIWEENLNKINEHNQNPKATFSMKMNQFGDLTIKEFSQGYFNRPPVSVRSNFTSPKSQIPSDIPVSVDWRSSGCVGPIIDQGQCGSSWAFGVTASMEGALCAKKGNLVTLSAQQLIDCSQSFGNFGCNGGFYDTSYDYIKQYGLESNESYPYTAVDGDCAYDKSRVIASCKGEVNVTAGDEAALAAALANIGPITIAVDASHSSFQFYSGGIYYEPACSESLIDHGVATVGYGSLGPNQDYFIVKNTWGTKWGDKGFIYMSRNRQNNCGIATYGTYPIL